MALKKLKPLSPDIYLGKIKGDNEVARLGHVNDIVSKFRKTYQFEPPALNDVITIMPNHVETMVYFTGPITNNFTINISLDPRFTENLEVGDKIYIFVQGSGTLTITGDMVITKCGDSETSYIPTDPVAILGVFNGTKFVGVDIC